MRKRMEQGRTRSRTNLARNEGRHLAPNEVSSLIELSSAIVKHIVR